MPKFSVERSIYINASQGQVYATVRDFRQWPIWSPWLICEADCKLKFDDDARGYSWDGQIIGSGNIRVTEEREGESIEYQLTFLKPWKSTSAVQFQFSPNEAGTKVTWSMQSTLPIFLFFLKKMMIGWIGIDYDRGLLMLKDLVENGEVLTKVEPIGEDSFTGFAYVGIRAQCAMSGIGPAMERDFRALMEKMGEAGIEPAGKAFSIYHQWNIGKGSVDYTVGFPVQNAPASLPLGIISDRLPDCPVFTVKHTGAYHHLGNAWSAGYARERAKIFKLDKQIAPFETYENDPRDTHERELVALVQLPRKAPNP